MPQPSYRAPWVAVANPETISVTVKEKEWLPVLSFRPAKTLILQAAAKEIGKSGPRLAAGTVMVAMDNEAGIACQLERPKGRYFIGCVEDFNRDGSYEGFFLLNHANPYLFSAFRQPRHQKHWKIEPVKLGAASAPEVPEIKMVFLYENRAEIVKQSRFQLCVMRDGLQNVWGDATHGRGCLPSISIKDGGNPVSLNLYGRDVVISMSQVGVGTIKISGRADAVPVEL